MKRERSLFFFLVFLRISLCSQNWHPQLPLGFAFLSLLDSGERKCETVWDLSKLFISSLRSWTSHFNTFPFPSPFSGFPFIFLILCFYCFFSSSYSYPHRFVGIIFFFFLFVFVLFCFFFVLVVTGSSSFVTIY